MGAAGWQSRELLERSKLREGVPGNPECENNKTAQLQRQPDETNRNQ